MIRDWRTGITVAAVLSSLVSTSQASAQSGIRDRLSGAIEAVESACKEDISKFCGSVSRGEGRVLLCMQAHDDQLSHRCDLAVYRASRNLERVLNRVERVADSCWADIEKHCSDANGIGRCVVEKIGSLSESCRTVVAGLRQAWQGLAAIRGMPVFSADGRNLGPVVEVVTTADGKLQSVQVDVGGFLGIGGRKVTIDSESIELLADRINVRLTGDQVRSLPEMKKP
jgi:PRC-barrel domain/Cysteine rich repeat